MSETAGWSGINYNPDQISELRLRVREIQRAIEALQRTAPTLNAGIRISLAGMTVEKLLGVSGSLEVTGSADLGPDTVIAGTSMPGFIAAANATRSEVIAARSGEASLDARIDAVNAAAAAAQSTAGAAQSEITAARGGKASLDARLDDIESGAGGGIAALESRVDDLETAATSLQNQITALATSTSNAFDQIVSAINLLRDLHGLPPMSGM